MTRRRAIQLNTSSSLSRLPNVKNWTAPAVAQFERVFSTKLYRARNLMSKKKGLPRFGVKAFDGMHVPDEILDILSPVYPVGGAVAVLEPPRKLAVVPKVVFVGIGFSSFVRLLARDKAFPLLF